MRNILRILFVAPLLFGVLFISGCGDKVSADLVTPRTLTFWGVWEDSDAIDQLIADYQTFYPHISIEYTKVRYEEYEQKLIYAWIRGTGPDIFSVANTWIPEYSEFIAPMPSATVMGLTETSKTLGVKSETTVLEQVNTSPSLAKIINDYIDSVSADVIIGEEVYGLPLSTDNLVLFYNKDLLANAGIPLPPETWKGFVEDVPKLTVQDKEGGIIQSGAALGTAANISRSVDILSLLMIQNGTQMTDAGGNISFDTATDEDYFPGIKALEFYTDFASPTKEVYAWNNTMPNSLEAFTSGQVAYFFGYSYHIPLIEKEGTINYGISAVPQVSLANPKNFTNYWITTVSNKSENANEAWDFIKFTQDPTYLEKYLDTAKKPTALKTLINQQLQDFDLHIFAEQALTAKSWYRGYNSGVMEEAMQELIDNALDGAYANAEAMSIAREKIQATLQSSQ